MRKFKSQIFLILLLLHGWGVTSGAMAQAKKGKDENALLWEVSGNGLKQPSYLFGTFHLLGSDFLKTVPVVEEKMRATQAVTGELVIDSAAMLRMMPAMMLKNTTLDKLLKPEDYQQTADYLKAVSGYDLTLFNAMNPMTVQIMLMTFEWAKSHGASAADTPMDAYFQQRAKSAGKKVLGLETMEDQLAALYGQFPAERQAEMLANYVKERDKNRQQMGQMADCYRTQNLTCLRDLLFDDDTYSRAEMQKLLDDRNQNWMKQLPTMLASQPTFVAVGAGHLVGDQGLINLLRKEGYKLTPVALKAGK